MNPYIPNTQAEVKDMLAAIGAASIDELFRDIKPRHQPRSFRLPDGRSEMDVMRSVRQLADKNATQLVSFLGGGYYDHYIPAAATALISRGEFYTAYTPYQPECSQGTLQALYEYQSTMCTLTGMDVSNASLYDGGTALYEAMMMALRVTRRNKIILDSSVSPIYRKIIRTYTSNLDIDLTDIPVKGLSADKKAMMSALDDKTAAVIVQNPNFFGTVDDYSDVATAAHKKGALMIMSVYPIALGLVKTPAAMDADIVTGEGQSLGLPLNFGGPYLGFMATKKAYIRKMPGRIVGQTVDMNGKRSYVNTLQAREQHIRREKATSNICTNVSLCALEALIYLSLLGKAGLKDLATLILDKTAYTREVLGKIDGITVDTSVPVFNEFVIRFDRDASDVVSKLIDKGFAAGFPLGRYYPDMKDGLLVAVTEKRTKEDIITFAHALEAALLS